MVKKSDVLTDTILTITDSRYLQKSLSDMPSLAPGNIQGQLNFFTEERHTSL